MSNRSGSAMLTDAEKLPTYAANISHLLALRSITDGLLCPSPEITPARSRFGIRASRLRAWEVAANASSTRCLVFSPRDGNLAAGFFSGEISILDGDSCQKRARCVGHDSSVNFLPFHPMAVSWPPRPAIGPYGSGRLRRGDT